MQNALPPRALLGTSAAVLTLQADTRLAEQTDADVLITGEPGVGKHALARLIHSRSARRNGPFESIECAGLSQSEASARLFGQSGSPNNPSPDGLVRRARRGTLFINHFDELSVDMQSRLSYVLENKDRLSSGPNSTEGKAWDVRLIVGAHPSLYEHVRSGAFPERLFYRLNVIHIVIPPLRQRIDDLPAHLHDYLTACAHQSGVDPPHVTAEALARLKSYHWPGNDAELEQVARQLVERRTSTITPRDLPPELMKS